MQSPMSQPTLQVYHQSHHQHRTHPQRNNLEQLRPLTPPHQPHLLSPTPQSPTSPSHTNAQQHELDRIEDSSSIQDLIVSVEQGSINAMVELGNRYRTGSGVVQDVQRSKQLFERASEQGSSIAMNNLGRILRHGDRSSGIQKDVLQARQLFEDSIKLGNSIAMNNLGRLLQEGDTGVPKDIYRAKELFEQSIELGNILAMNNLGRLHQDGDEESNFPKNTKMAKYYYEKAIESDNTIAMTNLAHMLQRGTEDVPKDVQKAIELYELAISKGNILAMTKLAFLYQHGLDSDDSMNTVQRDLPKSKYLYELAIQKGRNKYAMYHLARLLEKDHDDVPQDISKAKILYKQALQIGYAPAASRLSKLNDLESAAGASNPLVTFNSLGEQQHQRQQRANSLVQQQNELHQYYSDRSKSLDSQHLLTNNRSASVEVDENGQSLPGTFVMNNALNLEKSNNENSTALTPRHPETSPVCTTAINKKETDSVELNEGILETAFAYALSHPSILSEDYLIRFIKNENVKSVTSLLAGHNLILLGIRFGIITRSNLNQIGNSSWYFHDNLYLPGSKIISEDSTVIDAIFQHAERVGIIKDGYTFKIARELRSDLQETFYSMGKIFCELNNKVVMMEQKIHDIENRLDHVDGDLEELFTGVKVLCENQKNIQSSITNLSNGLTDLRTLIRKKDRNAMYAGLAKCALSLIPVVGSSLGQGVGTGMKIFMGLTGKHLLMGGMGAAKAAIDYVSHVDLSNFKIAKHVFSTESLDKLGETQKSNITKAIESSEFQLLSSLQFALDKEVETARHSNLTAFLIDSGDSSWLATTSLSSTVSVSTDEFRHSDSNSSTSSRLNSQQSSASSSPSSSFQHLSSREKRSLKLDEKAQKCFQFISHDSENGNVSVCKAASEMNRLLVSEGMKEINEEEFENLYLDNTDDSIDDVDEIIFLKIFRYIREEYESKILLDDLENDCRVHFREKAKNSSCNALRIRMAVRVVKVFWRHVESKAHLEDDSVKQLDCQCLLSYDENGDRMIDEDEFVNAVMSLVKKKVFGDSQDSQ